jgi:tight adherence protein C
MGIGIGIAIIVAMVVVGVLVYVGLREESNKDPLQDRLAKFADEGETVDKLEDIELTIPFRERVLVPFARGLAAITVRFTPQKQLEQTRHKLELAGSSTDATAFFGGRIIATILGGALGMMMAFVVFDEGFTMSVLIVVGSAALGFYFPIISLNSRISKRQENIVKALPDALDLLVICVEAGLGFDMAMGKVYEKWDNELALAFGRVLREIQLGKLRRESLKDMSDRMGVTDVNSFTAAIIQADQLGVSMAKILRVQADQMRTKRRQRAQERAQQAPVKMMIPMVLLIFPSLWIVLLGPAALTIASGGAGPF